MGVALVLVSLLVGSLVTLSFAGRDFILSGVDVVAVGIGVWGLVVARRRGRLRLDPAIAGHVGLLVVILLQLIGGDDRAAMIGGSSRVIGPALIILGLSQVLSGEDDDPVVLDVDGRRDWPRLFVGFGAVLAVWILVLAARALAAEDVFALYGFKTNLVMPLGASNYLAAFLLVPGMVAVAMVREDRRYLVPLAVITAGLLATISRGAFIAVAVAGVSFVVVRVWQRAAPLLLVPPLLASVLTVAVAISHYSSTGQSTVDGRLRLWGAAWDGFAASPLLGVGYNDLLDVTAVLEQQHPNAHNLLLHSLATTGVLGAVAYTFIWVVLAKRLLSAEASARRDALLVAMIALWVHAQIEALAYTRAVEALLAVMIVCAGTLPVRTPSFASIREVAWRSAD